MANIHEHIDLITMGEMLAARKCVKNKKTPGTDSLNKERECASHQYV
jgi:hypothetical protein